MNLLDRLAYDSGGYTVQEILSSFTKKILEIIDLVNKNEEVVDEAHTLIENIRNEVVPDLVNDIMKEMQDNGYFDTLVNVTLIEQLRTELTTLLNNAITDYTTRLDNINLELNNKTYYFTTVADMKSKDVKIGDYVFTTGYYVPNDGGESCYRIIDNNNKTCNDGDLIKLDNGLIAELVPKNGEINIVQFGAKCGNKSWDSSTSIQNAINYVYNSYKNGVSYSIIFNGGVYRIDKQLELNYYTRIKSNGLVKIWCYNKGNSALYFKHVPSLEGESPYGWQGFQQSYLIDGSVGGFNICGTQRDTTEGQIGLDYGSNDNYNGLSGALLKNGIIGVEFSNFSIGMRINTYHNYLMHFENLGFRNCHAGVQFGDEQHKDLKDSGENITFDKCTFGGCGVAIKGYSAMIFKAFRCSFDMNNCAIEATGRGGIVHLNNCWLERNGLTSYVDYQKGSYGLFVNTDNNVGLAMEIIDCYITYGGDSEGKQISNNLIRGNIVLKLRNLRGSFGTDFYDGEKKRLFLCSNDVTVRDKGEFYCPNMCLHEYSCENYNNMFQNVTTGNLLPITANQTIIGDYLVTGYLTLGVVECLEEKPLSVGGKVLHLVASDSGGSLKLTNNDYIPLSVGKTIRPLVIFDKAVSTNSGVSVKILLFDGNKNQIGEPLSGGYDKQGNEFFYNPTSLNTRIPQNAVYYKIEYRAYFNSGSGELFIKGLYHYTW